MRGVVVESIMGRYEVSKGPALRLPPLLIGVSKANSRGVSLHHSGRLGTLSRSKWFLMSCWCCGCL